MFALRGSPIAVPPQLDYWPEGTDVGETDIVVAGISLQRLVEVCGTPAVHSASAVIPNSGQLPSEAERAAVLVVRVLAVTHHASGAQIAQVDARLDNLRLVWSETRLMGRMSTARPRTLLIVRRPDTTDLSATSDVIAVTLPRDVHTGDLLVIPSRTIRVDMVRPDHPLTGRQGWRPDSVLDSEPSEVSPWWESIE